MGKRSVLQIRRLVLAALALFCVGAMPAGTATPEEQALAPYQPPAAPDTKAWPRERLLGFLRELADFVQQHHTVTDPQRKTFGMVYEFWKDGKWLQEFGLDSMHDGAWFMSALATAQRADPAGDWLARAQKFQVPFYTNLLNHSDRLFPNMQPASEDKRPWTAPLKGWAPRGWDDGAGFDRRTGQPFADSYFTGSNHLAQDLADSLLNVWLSTRDPQISEALIHLRNYKRQCFGPIQGLEIGAAVANGSADAFVKYQLHRFGPSSMNPWFAGLYEQKAERLPSYDDGLAWAYRQATAAAQISGEFPRGVARHLATKCYGYSAALEAWFDDRPYEHGIYFFDLQRPPAFVEGTGKLSDYASTSKNFYGPRGVQISAVAAGVLPELKARPALWSELAKQKLFAGDARILMTDAAPKLDGARDVSYGNAALSGAAAAPKNGADVYLLSDPKHLHLFVEASTPEVTLSFQHAGPVAGETRVGRIKITRDGKVDASNDRGERLLAASSFKPGERWSAELRLPYSVAPAQSQWINGVDFGRYKVTQNERAAVTILVLSEPERILRRLEHLALGTIDYWHRVWKEAGVIPSGWRSPTVKAGSWEISDAGNYAHLIYNIALWIIYQDGRREWEIIREDFPAQPKPAQPLPASVRKAQGLEP
ncbi:MAG: hypothetical protein M3463_06195 [Verrucomicrobiota bacterium]|nr:hypothetical protein [Verrucomicrobiota bacterium]